MIALRPTATAGSRATRASRRSSGPTGRYIHDIHLPPPGTPTQGVEGGYMANAWVRMLHPDYDQLRAMLDRVGETVKVHAE